MATKHTSTAKPLPATVHSVEYARAYGLFKRTPVHRRAKLKELLSEECTLVRRLSEVRSMLSALSGADEPVIAEPAKVIALSKGRATVGGAA